MAFHYWLYFSLLSLFISRRHFAVSYYAVSLLRCTAADDSHTRFSYAMPFRLRHYFAAV